jgi:hypothetical protein
MSRERALYRLGRGRTGLINIPSSDAAIKLRVEAAEQSDDDFQGCRTRTQEVSGSQFLAVVIKCVNALGPPTLTRLIYT